MKVLTCLDAPVFFPKLTDERTIPAQLLGERIDPSELDSGRNVGEMLEEAISDEDPLAKEVASEDLEIADVEMQLSTTKKRGSGRTRR